MASIKWPTVSVVSTGSTGGISGGSNAGTGEGVFRSVSGINLTFKSIVGSSDISVTSNADEIILALSAGSIISDGQNLGAGQEIFTSKSGTDLLFRTLVGGDNVNLSSGSNSITINAVTSSVQPGITTIQSPGSGEQINIGPSGSLRTLIGGTNVTLVSGSDSITINSVSSGPTGIVQNTSLGGDQSILGGPSGSFRGLTAGTNISLTSGTSDITINAAQTGIQENVSLGAGESLISGPSGSFRSLLAGGNISLTSGTNNITINAITSSVKQGILTNVSLGGESIISGPSGSFRGLTAGTNISFVSGANDITINSSGGPAGGITTISSLGGDEPVNSGPSGSFRGLTAGNGITLTSGTNDITLSLPSGVEGNVLQYNSSNVPVVVDRPLVTQYVVGPGADEYSTIGAAITAAQSDGNTYDRHNMCVILIKPNSSPGYTEDVNIPDGFCLSSLPGNSPFDGLSAPVQIIGTVTMSTASAYGLLNGIMVRTNTSGKDAVVVTDGFLAIHECTIQTLNTNATALRVSSGTVTIDGSTQLLAFGGGTSYAIERTGSGAQIIAYSSGVRVRASSSGIAILDSGGLFGGTNAGLLFNGPEIVGQVQMTANASTAQGGLFYNTVHSVVTNDAPFRITAAGSGTPGVNTNGSTTSTNTGLTLNGISIRGDGGGYSGPYIQVDTGVCRLYLGYVTCDDAVTSLDPVNDGIHVLNQDHDTDGNASYIRRGIVTESIPSGSLLVYNGSFLWDAINTGSIGGGGATQLNDLSDVDLSAFTPSVTSSNGEVLYYSGSNWSSYTPYYTKYTVGPGSLYPNFSDILPLLQSEDKNVISVRFMPGVYKEDISIDFSNLPNCNLFEIIGPSSPAEAEDLQSGVNNDNVIIDGRLSASLQAFAFSQTNISIKNISFFTSDSTPVDPNINFDFRGSAGKLYMDNVSIKRSITLSGTGSSPVVKVFNTTFDSLLSIKNCNILDDGFASSTNDISNVISAVSGTAFGEGPELFISNSKIVQSIFGVTTYPSGSSDGCILIQNNSANNYILNSEINAGAIGINVNSCDGFSANPVTIKDNTITTNDFNVGSACILFSNSGSVASAAIMNNIFETAHSGIRQEFTEGNNYAIIGNSFQVSNFCWNIPVSSSVFLDYSSNNYAGLPSRFSGGNFFSDRGTPTII